jgi:hypothetical protein
MSVYTTTRGDSLNIACIVKANPFILQNIEWRFNSRIISPTDTRFLSKIESNNFTVLSISSMRETEDGNFICSINNRIGMLLLFGDFQ